MASLFNQTRPIVRLLLGFFGCSVVVDLCLGKSLSALGETIILILVSPLCAILPGQLLLPFRILILAATGSTVFFSVRYLAKPSFASLNYNYMMAIISFAAWSLSGIFFFIIQIAG